MYIRITMINYHNSMIAKEACGVIASYHIIALPHVILMLCYIVPMQAGTPHCTL